MQPPGHSTSNTFLGQSVPRWKSCDITGPKSFVGINCCWLSSPSQLLPPPVAAGQPGVLFLSFEHVFSGLGAHWPHSHHSQSVWQGLSLQLFLSVAFPLHSPLDSQVLLLVRLPLPQVEEHGVHWDHLSHSGFNFGGESGFEPGFTSQGALLELSQTHLYPLFPRVNVFKVFFMIRF